jgi:Tfp pilus assembly protein PilV
VRMNALRRPAGLRGGALLLEVVISIAILVLAFGMLGAELSAGLQMTQEADKQTRAAQLSDRILALLELDQKVVQQVFADQDTDGEFGEQYPGWFWKLTLEPTDVAGLGMVTIEVLHQEDSSNLDSIEGARVVRSMHLLKADPGRIDLAADFGFDEEQLAALAASIPIPGFNPAALDPQALVAMDPAQLMAMLPQLLQIFQQITGGGGLPQGMPAGLQGLLANLGGAGGGAPGGAGSISQDFLRNFIQSQLGDRVSADELDKLFSGGGGRPGGNANPDGGPQPPGDGRMSREAMGEMLRGALGDRVSDAELEQVLDQYESGGGGGGGTPPPPPRGGGGGGNGAGGGRGGGNGQPPGGGRTNIRNINNGRGGRGSGS